MIFIKYLIMTANLKWLLIITTVNMFMACGIEGSCLTFSRLSCTQGSKRGLTVQNRPETRLIPAMEFNCTGTLVGWTVSGRNGSGTAYPKLQIWRRNSTNRNLYFKNGPEIQIDAQGSACEFITQNINCHQEFYCRLSAANQISVHSGTDIIGVELPLLDDQGFELLFIGPVSTIVANRQYVWTREISTLNINAGSREFLVYDHLLISVDVCPTIIDVDIDECLANTDGCDQVCTNTIGSFQCSCIDGYILSSDGRSCLDIDECTTGTHNCQQRCINIPGGFLCDCNLGYQLNSDRRNCGDINECTDNNVTCQHICFNVVGSFLCSCRSGYVLDTDQHSCIEIKANEGTKEQSFLTTGAVVGGLIGTPLLFTIFLLVVALVCTSKKNQRKSNRGDPAGMSTQMRDIHMAKTSSDIGKGSVEISSSPFIYDIYSTIPDEDKITSANDDEYIKMNPANP